jgi:hypothetical protein
MRIRYLPTAVALGAFLAGSYVVCSVWDGLFPSWAMHTAWEPLLPGFSWWSFGSFLLGLVESFAYGFWLALVVPLVRLAHRLTTRTEGVPVTVHRRAA